MFPCKVPDCPGHKKDYQVGVHELYLRGQKAREKRLQRRGRLSDKDRVKFFGDKPREE